MEKQIRPGIYLSVITRGDYIERATNLNRAELTTFIMKAIPLRFVQSDSLIRHGIERKDLIKTCLELQPDLDPETDYYVLREMPRST
jgi:hypothetical protein